MTDEATAVIAAERWGGLARTTGIVGLVAVVLLFTPIIAISTLGEPAFDGSRDEVAAFFRAADTPWVTAGGATVAIGMLAFLWFAVGLSTLLRRIEGEPAWRSTVVLVSGTIVAAYGIIDASWDAAANRGGEVDPGVALFAFDLGNLGFANTWVALGSFAIASGWAMLVSRALPAWWGWWAIAAGAGLVVVRYAWEWPAWMLPYLVFWAWAVAVAIRLLVRRRLETRPAA
jgi:hypothetical protein